MQYAEILVDVPIARRQLHYSIPPSMLADLSRGSFVRVPFRKKLVDGIVIDLTKKLPLGLSPGKVRPIHRLVVSSSKLPTDLISLASWMAKHYLISLPEALFTIIPPFPQKRQMNFGPIEKAVSLASRKYFISAREESRWESYYQAIKKTMQNLGSAVVIFPSISKAEDFSRFLQSRQIKCHIYSGRLPRARRFRLWERLARGEFDCVVGTRLAVFAPLPQLKLVIIDDESHPGHTEEQHPRYNSLSVAFARLKIKGGVLIAGGILPSQYVYFKYKSGELRFIDKPYPLPSATLVDSRSSPLLSPSVETSLEKNKAAVITTKLGVGGATRCRDCDHLLLCPHCDLPLTLHIKSQLICHHCGHRELLGLSCPNCDSQRISPSGAGAEQLENYLKKRFPQKKIARLEAGQQPKLPWDILVATVKILDTDLVVPTVAVYSLDTIIELPDPFAVERVAQLLINLRTRASKDFYVQTRMPDHRVFKVLENSEEYLESELALRQSKRYPPHITLIRLMLAGPDKLEVAQRLTDLARRLRQALNPREATVLGPGPAFYEKLKGTYRWHLLIKLEESHGKTTQLIRSLLPPQIQVSVNPPDLL